MIVIELMIALHFLCSSAGMITVKPVTLICAVEPSCFATAFAMSMSKPAAFPLTIDSAGGYVVSTHQTIGFGMFERLRGRGVVRAATAAAGGERRDQRRER